MSWNVEYHSLGSWMSPSVMGLREQAAATEELLSKAFTTGSGVVQPGATGGQALRTQFLPKVLQQVSFEQDDAGMMKIIKKKKVPSNTIEWSDYMSYGSNGDGFVGETGATGGFDVRGADDNFARQIQRIKYMGISRTVGLVASMVTNQIDKPMDVSEKGATLALVAQMNLALYDGDETMSDSQYNGFFAQIGSWVTRNPTDADLLFDCGGQPLSKDILEEIAEILRRKYGRGSMLMSTIPAYGDLQRSLYPEERLPAGAEGIFGVDKRTFKSTRGPIKLMDDVMFRANSPLVADGPGSDGKPRTVATATPGAAVYASTPWVGAPTDVASGTGRFWANRNLNTDSTTLGTVPETPKAGYGGNNNNRLDAGNYYYAIAAVYGGLESPAYVYGEAAAGVVTGAATAVAVTAGHVVRIDINTDPTGPCITGLGTSTLPSNLVKWRIYRTPKNLVPTSLQDFDYLMDCACPIAGNARAYDNGMYIPGSERALYLTESKNGADGFFMAELLPLLKRPLPHLAMADLFALLAFVALVLWVPRHHIALRNIGRATNY